MAAPLIAGAAALVRQYFQKGMYPTGPPVSNNSFSPSGPLVKAMLIGGAAGLSGFEPDTGLPLSPPPSFRQGFGRLQLSQSLPLQVCLLPCSPKIRPLDCLADDHLLQCSSTLSKCVVQSIQMWQLFVPDSIDKAHASIV